MCDKYDGLNDNLPNNLYEGQTTQWPKEKGQTTIHKTYI
jgi:hypothetical protein